MECEQRSLLAQGITLKGLEGPAGIPNGFAAATKHVAAMHLRRSASRRETGVDHEAGNVPLACIWCACSAEGQPSFLEHQLRQDTIQMQVLYSKEWHLLAYAVTTAGTGDPASVCKTIESFGEEVLGSSTLWLKVAGGNKAAVLSSAVCTAPSHHGIFAASS
eukprot:gnl/TRDRNA2_/TRDRNA2_171853_c5_seq1.p1 gnl/TRDRNA2_/TRDRNA2_171853_c5~~gnl/TRDRNA2_/TRDRNA2_171853_c5_seq1.p1  ORF type:complete len:162 (+),score=21.62 gnl/TRDRNA2_/TRDRNA2_171853_c5_seq1:418-903(+)